jgi:uncharacterized membrane protein YtjA (UPF0391 family)
LRLRERSVAHVADTTLDASHSPGGFLVQRSKQMLQWALTFLVVALIAAALGFGGVAGTAAYIGKVLFFLFLVFFIVALIAGMRPRPV